MPSQRHGKGRPQAPSALNLLQTHVRRYWVAEHVPLDRGLLPVPVEHPRRLRAERLEQPDYVAVYHGGEVLVPCGVEEALVVRHAVADLVYRVDLAVQLSSVGAFRPRIVKMGNSQVALAAAVGQVRPEAHHEVRDDLVGVVSVVGATLRL